jgi:ketosteroid isomerase-like protein
MALTLEDRLDITELVGRYDQAIDFRDAAAYADTFVEDGVFQINGQPEIKGHEKLMRMIERLGPQGSRHWINNMVIEGDGDYARMTCYLMVLSGLRVTNMGYYVNTLRKVEGKWKFVRRDYTPDARPEPAAQPAASS